MDNKEIDWSDIRGWQESFAKTELGKTKEWLQKYGLAAREAALVVGGYSMNPTPEEIGTIDYSRFETSSEDPGEQK